MNVRGIPHAPRPVVNATAAYIRAFALPAALSMLPPEMNSPKARAIAMTIGMQESRFEDRRQIGGPAHSFFQMESGGGVHGVLTHPATKPLIAPVLDTLRIQPGDCYDAITYNDVLACVFARLLLWTHPKPLPGSPDAAWLYYIGTWRPGKPRRETWDAFYHHAAVMEGLT